MAPTSQEQTTGKSKPKSGIDSTIRIAFGLVHGLILAMIIPILYATLPHIAKNYSFILLFIILPIVSYIGGLGLNSFSQYISCNAVSIPQVSLVSLIGPAIVLLFSFIISIFPGLRSPIETILPITADTDMKYAIGISFYLLWAGIYAQNIGSGMVQSCPGAAGPK